MATPSQIDAVLREIADRIQTNQKRLTAGRAQIASAGHQIESVRPEDGPAVRVNGPLFQIDLAPRATARLNVRMKRCVRAPPLRLP